MKQLQVFEVTYTDGSKYRIYGESLAQVKLDRQRTDVKVRRVEPRTDETDQLEAIGKLRELLKPGDSVYTSVNSVSRSGMSRHISLVIAYNNKDTKRPDVFNITWLASRALGWTMKGGCLRVSGCGMDMCFHTVYSLGRMLFPHGFVLGAGKWPRNGSCHCGGKVDHGSRKCTACGASRFRDNDGGYALEKRNL